MESLYSKMMDARDKELIDEVLEALRLAWLQLHQERCGDYPHEGLCNYPKLPVLLKWEGDGSKCAYCGGNRESNKPWQIYCSQKCNAAAWRKRERDKKEKEMATQ